MKEKKFQFTYKIVEDSNALSDEDAALLQLARKTTRKAYAPYSKFNVACAAKLANGRTVVGSNQENASYPVGICAERALLATVGTQYSDEPIHTLAVTYHPVNSSSNRPISPCGMCRQALSEYEKRTATPIRLLLSGMEGPVYIINTVKDLLPLAFSEEDLGRKD
ncbi:cytidine deaminase [Niabella drilacis]|uniref:Cytidine deaminase n=1 Tax=Niabella drilacis (strain DSM 25811 / CCM 8410 / CCUG 62505 / LMG 26954 / E90) TaxID=1285928 RepID=A0A1G6YC92_NIADE|nr:cytidine deaminase [Niabella drilacis]SDD87215.1 cytidine deaminase [Niabella drilacis]